VFGMLSRCSCTVFYNMQGTVPALPAKLKESAGAFRGAWTEAGSFGSVAQAFELLKAWLLEEKDVDELPLDAEGVMASKLCVLKRSSFFIRRFSFI
jgi:hypothetical protein